MNSVKNLLTKNKETISGYTDFWNWFQKNSSQFFDTIKTGNRIEKFFFRRLSEKLLQLKDGIFFLVGMKDAHTVELIFTPDGVVKNIVFVEDLVQTAPAIKGWKFTALKQECRIQDATVEMKGYIFNNETLSFYSNDYPEYPDEVDITIIHTHYKEEDKAILSGGACIFLDNYLGELNFINTIDNLNVIGPAQVEKEPVPASKLKEFLIWREKEFLEKYERIRYDTEYDNYASLEGMLQNGKPIIAIVNSTLLRWEGKASHPWILKIGIKFEGHYKTGMPDDDTYHALNTFEEHISERLKGYEGYLNIGRQTSDGIREIYYACKDFRKPSNILYQLRSVYEGSIDFRYDIYKDKYWQSFEHFKLE